MGVSLAPGLGVPEAVAPGDKKAEGAIKRLITEDTLFIEPKGVDPFEVPNFLHVMMASNHEQAVSAGDDCILRLWRLPSPMANGRRKPAGGGDLPAGLRRPFALSDF